MLTVIAAVPSAAKQKVKQKAKVALATISRNDQRRFDIFFIDAVNKRNAGDYAEAFSLFQHCLEINPNAAEAHYELARLYSALRIDSTAERHMERAAALCPDDEDYQEKLANYYLALGKYGKATKVYEHLVERDHERTDILNILASLYQNSKDYDKMLDAIERIEQIDGMSEEITFAKMHVYDLQGNKKMAYRSLKSLSDAHPNDVNYRVMLANWLMQNQRQAEAFKLLADAEREEPENAIVQSSLYDYYNSVGNDSLAAFYRDGILISKKTETKTKVTLLQQVIQDNEAHGGDSTKVLSLFDKIINANPTDGDMYQLAVAYMTLKKMPKDTLRQMLRRTLEVEPEAKACRFQLIQSLWEDKLWDEIIALSEDGVQYTPQEMPFYYFLGLAHYQKDDRHNALDAFRRGVGEITPDSDPDIVSDFYALMGDILQQEGRTDEAFAAYDSCLQWKDDNIMALNNYAYYLSERDSALSRAEQMSYKTISAEPNNSTYLDTYAWILFQQERYTEAVIYAEQAVKNDTDSVKSDIIIEHMGDIYAMVGKTDDALLYWQKALDTGKSDHEALLRRKIREKRYIKE